ncbi:permease prefix domain 1-containing protein [Clostridium cochlearium]|uniref:permease prefix domain 1-containing protein n=1 Tax=Clostridium cochlearium TaxID=1494 RepID=UPI000BBC6D94|nr:permease prefix domain 1-containing protein [Clostridium cochlearium]
MGIEKDERVCKYLNEIISKVRNKESHEEIKLELISHIEELYDSYVKSGMGKDEAIRNSITQMGNADIIGEKLDKVHRGNLEWGIVVATVLMSFIGIFTAIFIGISGEITHYNQNSCRNMIISTLIGITLAMALYKFDYRELKKYSIHILIGTNLLMILSILFSNYVNGSKYITIMSISINITPIYLFLMSICLPGILQNIKLKGTIDYLKLIGSYIIPIVLIAMIPDIFYTFYRKHIYDI